MFFDILVGCKIKIEIWGDQSGCEMCGYFWSGFWAKNKTPDCESDVLWMGYYSFIVSADNQFDSGFAIRRAFI